MGSTKLEKCKLPLTKPGKVKVQYLDEGSYWKFGHETKINSMDLEAKIWKKTEHKALHSLVLHVS